jgi:hypothetical protein
MEPTRDLFAGRGLPVGWASVAAPAPWQEPQKRVGRRAGSRKNAEPNYRLREIYQFD